MRQREFVTRIQRFSEHFRFLSHPTEKRALLMSCHESSSTSSASQHFFSLYIPSLKMKSSRLLCKLYNSLDDSRAFCFNLVVLCCVWVNHQQQIATTKAWRMLESSTRLILISLYRAQLIINIYWFPNTLQFMFIATVTSTPLSLISLECAPSSRLFWESLSPIFLVIKASTMMLRLLSHTRSSKRVWSENFQTVTVNQKRILLPSLVSAAFSSYMCQAAFFFYFLLPSLCLASLLSLPPCVDFSQNDFEFSSSPPRRRELSSRSLRAYARLHNSLRNWYNIERSTTCDARQRRILGSHTCL